MSTPSTGPFLPTSTFTTPRGYTYHYIYALPSHSQPQPPKSAILVLHGFPSIPHDFHSQITDLLSHNHAIVAPYLLGYHPTSTPKDPKSYRLKLMCDDIVALLRHLDLLPSNYPHLNNSNDTSASRPIDINNEDNKKAPKAPPLHALAHDWGSTLLSRLTYYHPHLMTSQIYLSIGPTPLGTPFDLTAINKMTKEFLGYEAHGYQAFFMGGDDPPMRAAGILGENHDRMEELMFVGEIKNADGSGDGQVVDGEKMWREYFARVGGLEGWLTDSDSRGKTGMIRGVTEALLRKRRETFVPVRTTRDTRQEQDESSDQEEFGAGYGGPLMWYVGLNTNINVEDEQGFREDWGEFRTDHKVLLVLTSKDPTVNPDLQVDMTKSRLLSPEEQLSTKTLDSGHFVMLEQPDELNAIILNFYQNSAI